MKQRHRKAALKYNGPSKYQCIEFLFRMLNKPLPDDLQIRKRRKLRLK